MAVLAIVTPDGVNQHIFGLTIDKCYWIMLKRWPRCEDRVGQVVKYATIQNWSQWNNINSSHIPGRFRPEFVSLQHRTDQGLRWISRGFWELKENFWALALDEAQVFWSISKPSCLLDGTRNPNAWEVPWS